MAAEDPAPDNDTMESLLDANEQLQAALNAHQRAALSAKKSLGISAGGGTPTAGTPSPDLAVSGAVGAANGSGSGSGQGSSSRSGSQVRRDNGKGREETLPELPAREVDKGKGAEKYELPPGPPPGRNHEQEDPFRDPDTNQQGGPSFLGNEAMAFDTFNPGFTAAGSGSGSAPKGKDDDIYGSGPKR